MLRSVFGAAMVVAAAAPATAGGYGCEGQCYRQEWAPPVYEHRAEKVLLQAPRTYAYVTPAAYRTVHETVMVSPGSRHWMVKLDAYGRKVGCWVETPPRYATVPRTVMVHGPVVTPVAVPAQYGIATSTVMTQPAHKAWLPMHGHGF